MSNELVCPVCGERFRDEDFCPVHGVRLVIAERNASSSESMSDDEGSSAEARTSTGEQESLEATPVEEASAPAHEHESRLASFMSRLGLRSRAGGAANPDSAAPSPASSRRESTSPLPEEVAEKGWKIAGPVRSGGGIDTWPVEMTTPSGSLTGWFHRYRTGALTAAPTYQRLVETASLHLARVWAHGTVDFAEARADFDVVSSPTAGVALDKWLADTRPSEQRALHLFEALVRLLERVSEKGFRPMVFDPSQVLRGDDGELCLAWVCAMAEVSETDAPAVVQYRPEFARSTLLPHGWSAPELVQQTVLSANAAVFSLGQILAQALWGQPCSHAELQTGAVPFHAISDSRLARILMGCLWPRSKGRWTLADLARAVECGASDDMPSVSPWASLAPGASSVWFSFAGESYWRVEDLLAAALKPMYWAEATNRIGAILEWAESTAWVGQAKLMRTALTKGRSADWVLVNLGRSVRPEAPLSWRELDLTDSEAAESLAGLAQRALHGSAADVATMRDLFQADLRGAFSPTQRPA